MDRFYQVTIVLIISWLMMTGCIYILNIDSYQKKVKDYEKEIKELKQKNKECEKERDTYFTMYEQIYSVLIDHGLVGE